ncbi:hypothetical protein PHDIMM138B_24485 [Phytobacter diazotrophicus]
MTSPRPGEMKAVAFFNILAACTQRNPGNSFLTPRRDGGAASLTNRTGGLSGVHLCTNGINATLDKQSRTSLCHFIIQIFRHQLLPPGSIALQLTQPADHTNEPQRLNNMHIIKNRRIAHRLRADEVQAEHEVIKFTIRYLP